MRNSKFVRYSAVLLGLVVLRTKAQNGFCPMCTKGCCMVLTRSKPFWGQFWGQICEAGSDLHRSNKCADLVSLRNADTSLTGFSRRKSPTSQYISFILWQEVVRKSHATASPYTAPVTAGNPSVWAYSHSIGAVPVQSNTALKSPLFGDFLFYHKGIYLSSVKGDRLGGSFVMDANMARYKKTTTPPTGSKTRWGC